MSPFANTNQPHSRARKDGLSAAPVSKRLIYVVEGHRKIRGWDKKDMARALGFAPTSYSDFIKGRVGLSLPSRIRAYELGIPAEELLKLETTDGE